VTAVTSSGYHHLLDKQLIPPLLSRLVFQHMSVTGEMFELWGRDSSEEFVVEEMRLERNIASPCSLEDDELSSAASR